MAVNFDPGTFERVRRCWDDVIADMRSAAEAYAEDGWDTLELHPGSVTLLDSDEEGVQFTFDVLVPSGEFEQARAAATDADAAFDSFAVLNAEEAGIVYLVVVAEDSSRERALLYPLYYEASAVDSMRDESAPGEAIRSRLRPLRDDSRITLTHHDPAPFLPGESR